MLTFGLVVVGFIVGYIATTAVLNTITHRRRPVPNNTTRPRRQWRGICRLCRNQPAVVATRTGGQVCGRCALDVPLDQLPPEWRRRRVQ